MRLMQSTRVSILAVLMAGTAWAQTPRGRHTGAGG